MRRAIAVLALAASTATAGPAHVVLQNPAVFYSLDDHDARVLTVRKDVRNLMSILDTGDIEFSPGATINTQVVMPRAGICVGYMVVRVNGEPMLVPVYQMREGDTPPPEFDRDTGPIRNTYVPRRCK